MFDESTQIDVTELLNFNEAEIKFVYTEAEKTEARGESTQPEPGPERPLELDAQANLLRGLLHEIKSLTDRACDTAVREAQRSAQVEEMAGVELINLRLQLKEKNEALDARDRALREREALAKEKIESLQIISRDKDAQLENCHTRSRGLLGEIDGLNLRLNEAATAMKQAESRFRDFAEHQQGKMNELRDEVKAMEDTLQGKDAALRQLDEESRMAIGALERRLQTANANLETKEAELREKAAALQVAACCEQTVAQMMQQLAAESQTIMAELREKDQLVSEIENKMYRPFDNGSLWNNGAAVQERLL
jgi:DNA repair exonuclease SbcCD ATPase subunit